MKDMFATYDENSSRPDHTHKPYKHEIKILESLDNISIVSNGIKNELGIRVKHNTAFDLYLYLDGWVEGSTIDALLAESNVLFKVYDLKHKLVFEKTFVGAEIFNFNSKYLKVSINADEAKLLDIDSYKMNISLIFPDGDYELITENDSLLIVK